MQNLRDISNPTTALDMALEFMSKSFQLNNTTPTNNNQRSSSKPCYSQFTQLDVGNQIIYRKIAGIQLTQEEFDFMADAGDYDEIEKVTANCNLQDNLQQASTSGTQSDKAPVYDSDGFSCKHPPLRMVKCPHLMASKQPQAGPLRAPKHSSLITQLPSYYLPWRKENAAELKLSEQI
ncbi:hypothetical protein Tco_0615117 [Tanacetum coccineum]